MTGRPRRETWRDWQDERAPEPPLLTRAEVLAVLDLWETVEKVEERTLRYWEQEGLLPRPTREHRHGVTRTWYPSWAPDLVAILRIWQRAGGKLATLRDDLRAEARRLSLDPRPHPFPAVGARPAREEGQAPSFADFIAERYPAFLVGAPRFAPLPTYDPPTLPSWGVYWVWRGVEDAIRGQYRGHHFLTERVEVRLIDAAGQARVYDVSLPEGFEQAPWVQLPDSFPRAVEPNESAIVIDSTTEE